MVYSIKDKVHAEYLNAARVLPAGGRTMLQHLLWAIACLSVAAAEVKPHYEKGPQTHVLVDLILENGLLQKNRK